MPPDQYINFLIYVKMVIKLIFISPFNVVPSNFKELKEQLQGIFSKVIIRQSMSPLGAPILSLKKKGGSIIEQGYHQEQVSSFLY